MVVYGGGQAFSRNALPATLNIDGKDRPTTNSNGQPIHRREGARNFWKWTVRVWWMSRAGR